MYIEIPIPVVKKLAPRFSPQPPNFKKVPSLSQTIFLPLVFFSVRFHTCSLWENYVNSIPTLLEGRKIISYFFVTRFPEDPVRTYIESEI